MEPYGARHFKICQDVILTNGDKCTLGSTVVARASQSSGQMFIGHADEILMPLGSIFNLNRQADRVLLQVAHISRPAGEYGMPYVVLQAQRALVPVQVRMRNKIDGFYG